MSTRRGLVNNLFLGAGVGVNLYGAYFVLAFQGHLPPDWLPGAVLGYDDAVARGDDRRSARAGEGAGGVRGVRARKVASGDRGCRKSRRPRPQSADGGARNAPGTRARPRGDSPIVSIAENRLQVHATGLDTHVGGKHTRTG